MKSLLLSLAGMTCLLWIISSPVPSRAEISDGQPQSQADKDAPSKLHSSEDGWLDMSGFIDQAYGFVPMVIPITEPAVGYGAGVGLMFVDKSRREETAGFGRPNITVVGALGTENHTKGAAAGDLRHWMDDRLKTLVGVVKASVNLDFYGIGQDGQLNDHPLKYNLEPLGGGVQVSYRLGNSMSWAGFGYALAATKVKFDAQNDTEGLPDFNHESRVGGIMPSFTYDSRDNIFTPTEGAYFDLSAGLFSKAFGGDGNFQRVGLMGIYYLPLDQKWTLGVQSSATFSFGDVPFYMRPYISLRGAPVMRYQGEHEAEIEAELRWQFWKRFSLVGFAGAGTAWNDFDRYEKYSSIMTGGAGFRYELARKYGLHMGLDVGFGPDATAVYVQVGSAWMRP